jgi:arylformamidase
MSFVDLTHGFYAGMPSFQSAWYPQSNIHSVMTPENDPAGTGRTFTRLEMFAHNVTHVDTPKHFYHDRETLDQLPLDIFIGRACIADLSYKKPCEPITGEDIQNAVGDIWHEYDRLLIRTDYLRDHWGKPDFWEKPPYLTITVADWAVENKAVLVGLDCITDQPGVTQQPVHFRLLGAGIPILEYITNMHLVEKQVGYLVALPTKVDGVEAAPVRTIFFEDMPSI